MSRDEDSPETQLGSNGYRRTSIDDDDLKHSTKPFLHRILSYFVFPEGDSPSDSNEVRGFDVTLRLSGLGTLEEEGVHYFVECEVNGHRGIVETSADVRRFLLESNEVVEL